MSVHQGQIGNLPLHHHDIYVEGGIHRFPLRQPLEIAIPGLLMPRPIMLRDAHAVAAAELLCDADDGALRAPDLAPRGKQGGS
jgi:hypothetical protein